MFNNLNFLAMSFQHKIIGERPSTFWNEANTPLVRVLTPIHPHEFGEGQDIQYKDTSGKIQAEMHGLTLLEVQVLKTTKKL